MDWHADFDILAPGVCSPEAPFIFWRQRSIHWKGLMSNHDSGLQRFEIDFANSLAALTERFGDGRGVDDLLFVEEARLNAGADVYSPDWVEPFVAVVADLAVEAIVRREGGTGGLATVIPQAIAPALIRAVQLGYTEGYFAGKED